MGQQISDFFFCLINLRVTIKHDTKIQMMIPGCNPTKWGCVDTDNIVVSVSDWYCAHLLILRYLHPIPGRVTYNLVHAVGLTNREREMTAIWSIPWLIMPVQSACKRCSLKLSKWWTTASSYNISNLVKHRKRRTRHEEFIASSTHSSAWKKKKNINRDKSKCSMTSLID